MSALDNMSPNTISATIEPIFKHPTNQQQSIDFESIQGQFGWITISDIFMPYLIRSGQKYCSARIAESKLLQNYKKLCTEEVYSCFNVVQSYTTEAEAKLLNEINQFHCNNGFGIHPFTTKDKMITADDVQNLFTWLAFIDSAYKNEVDVDKAPCGFVQIDDQAPVPYAVQNDKKYLPIFYFECERNYLEDKSIDMTGWPLCYLKFCCKVQGIRAEYYKESTLKVADMDQLKSYLPASTTLTYVWPKDIVKKFYQTVEKENSMKKKTTQQQNLLQQQNLAQTLQQQQQQQQQQQMFNNMSYLNNNNQELMRELCGRTYQTNQTQQKKTADKTAQNMASLYAQQPNTAWYPPTTSYQNTAASNMQNRMAEFMLNYGQYGNTNT